jgi:hypothetical protein
MVDWEGRKEARAHTLFWWMSGASFRGYCDCGGCDFGLTETGNGGNEHEAMLKERADTVLIEEESSKTDFTKCRLRFVETHSRS